MLMLFTNPKIVHAKAILVHRKIVKNSSELPMIRSTFSGNGLTENFSSNRLFKLETLKHGQKISKFIKKLLYS